MGRGKEAFSCFHSHFNAEVPTGIERTYLPNYRDQLPRHIEPYNFIKERIKIMQHYGLKTRLMNWRFSPLVALHFALTEILGAQPATSSQPN